MTDGSSARPTSQAMQQTNAKSNQYEEDKRRKKTIRLVAWVGGSVGFLCICIGWLFYWLTCTKVIDTCNRVKDTSITLEALDLDRNILNTAKDIKTKIESTSLKNKSLGWAGLGTVLPPFGLYNIKHYLDAHKLGKHIDKVKEAINKPMDAILPISDSI